MKITDLKIKDLRLIELITYKDNRGFFVERFNAKVFQEFGLPTDFAQDNHSNSAPGVLRGLHYQYSPPQAKLIGVIHGRIWDVAVDLRHYSPTFGQHFGIELSAENGKLLWLPRGFAHGFCVLGSESADLLYKVDNPYNAKGENGIHWADPDLGIEWPIKNPIVSERDQTLPSFSNYKNSQRLS